MFVDAVGREEKNMFDPFSRPIFYNDEDYAAFERVMHEAQQRVPVRILRWKRRFGRWAGLVNKCSTRETIPDP
jgi:hypothetical protein